ncbi:Dyp-type peroxidase [Pseudoalteromonas xiamenensis]|uniref:Dyp-type peroxidase n=1 Tax=Pseudoalteromonas xiamenensis TaxID=882626 RepID=UPI0027E552F1|nr:Dyp-type peroxidase [Pseudoalteromonas xiamenensis]WMN61076.1 Dyp-type peroxidase [Pseudoalteromonas xiamenensis]
MAQAQSGLCAEANLHGLHLFFNVLDGHDEAVRVQLPELLMLQDEFNDQFSESMISSFIAVGAQYWPHIYPEFIPSELRSFPHISHSEHSIHSQPFDLLLVIRSDREDVNHLFAQRALQIFGPGVELVSQVRCFRFLDGRDFNGFVYGGDAPHGRLKRQVALVSNPNQPDDQGSYVHTTRVKFELAGWHRLEVSEQEQIMGRTRLDNQLILPPTPDSHATLSELKDENGLALLLNQSMPFGDVHVQGSLWLSCSAHGDGLALVLKKRLGDDECYDRWLDFTHSDMGAAFFAPSVQFLKSMAERLDVIE